MKHLVIGLGQVGSALRQVLDCQGHDLFKEIYAPEKYYDMIHICFGYDENFEENVKEYQNIFKPRFTVIHSTVPIGTSKKLNASHSPIRGQHPNLTHSIFIFKKYVGGAYAEEVAEEFKKYNITAEAVGSSDDTEAGKLFDLMQYGISILLNKEIHKFCQDNGINFDLSYTDFNVSYNVGYTDMRRPEFVRPVLKYMEGPIGGHCVVQMMKLLNSESAIRILEENEKWKSQ